MSLVAQFGVGDAMGVGLGAAVFGAPPPEGFDGPTPVAEMGFAGLRFGSAVDGAEGCGDGVLGGGVCGGGVGRRTTRKGRTC